MIIGGDSCSFYKTEKISNDPARKLKYAFRYIFEFKTPCCYLNHPQKVILVRETRDLKFQDGEDIDVLRRPGSSMFYGPFRHRESEKGYCPFTYLNDRLGSDHEFFDSLFASLGRTFLTLPQTLRAFICR